MSSAKIKQVVREAYNNGVAPKHFAIAKYITSL